jgi:hypothetical protein
VYQINVWWDQSSEMIKNIFSLSKDNTFLLSQKSETTQIRYFWVFKFWDNTQYWVIHVSSRLCCTVETTSHWCLAVWGECFEMWQVPKCHLYSNFFLLWSLLFTDLNNWAKHNQFFEYQCKPCSSQAYTNMSPY